MTKDEAVVLAEVANDVRWIKGNAERHNIDQTKALSAINNHLAQANRKVIDLSKKDIQRATDIKWLKRGFYLVVVLLIGGGTAGVAEIQGIINLFG